MPSELLCPRCGCELSAAEREKVATHECRSPKGCGGTWCKQETFDALKASALAEVAKDPDARVLPVAAFPGDSNAGDVSCPECGQRMEQRHFRFEAQPTPIVLDHCETHGIWFDAEELDGALRIVQMRGSNRSVINKLELTPEQHADRERHKRWLREASPAAQTQTPRHSRPSRASGGYTDDIAEFGITVLIMSIFESF